MKIFWAWQFDLPGKIAWHFIRNALKTAIAQINQTDEIDEPDEAFQDGRLQLDYGRKNLKGSPDLAIEILKKIGAATVFVGDVTPVGRGAPHKTDEGVESEGKFLMKEDRGFGFIAPDDGGADVFCHAKNINGASVLQPRQQVEFESEFDSARASHSAVMGRRQNQIMRTSLALYFPRALAAEVPCSAPVSD